MYKLKDGSIGDAEFTEGYIVTARIEGISPDDNHNTSASKKMMWMLRVGKLRDGDKTPKCTAINHGEIPPRMTANMRKAKLKLSEEIRCNNLMCYTDVSTMVDVYAVVDWVLMKSGMALPDTTIATAKRKRDDGNDDDAMITQITPPTVESAPPPLSPNNDNDDDDDAMIKQITPPTVESPLAPSRPTTTPTISCTVPNITPHGPNPIYTQQSSIVESTILSYTIRRNTEEKPDVSDEERKKFPALSKYYPEVFHRGRNVQGGVDLDFQLLQSIISESVALCKMKDEPLQYMHSNGRQGTRLIELPITLSKDRTEVQPNINRFIDEQLLPAININTAKEKADNDITGVLLDYLTDKRRQRLMEKLREMKLTPRVMNEYEVGTLLEQSGIKVRQWRIIRQCLKLFMDISEVSVPEWRVRELGTDNGVIICGSYLYSDPTNPNRVKEEVQYWTKDPLFEVLESVHSIINGWKLHPNNVKDISIIHGGDHGKQKFRFATKVIIRMNNGQSYAQVFGLADVACRKDHGEILDNTCMPYLIPGINEIFDSDIVLEHSSEDDSAIGENATFTLRWAKKDEDHHSGILLISPMSYMAGDLAFLAYMMGKENFSSQWCNWCRSTKLDWQTGRPILQDEMWTIDTINAQVEKIAKDKLTGTVMLGVRRSPIVKIPFNNIIFAGLHAGIGIGNMITDYLEEFIDVEVEHLSDEEFQTRQEKRDTEREVQELRAEKDVWLESPDGGKSLSSTREKLRKVESEMKKLDDNDPRLTILSAERNAYDAKLQELVASRDLFSNEISRMKKVIKAAKDKLEAFTKERRRGEESIYTSIDRIFQKHGANRAHYFGRAFEGVDIRKIMNKSDELFGDGGDIRVALLEKALDGTVATKINIICDNVGHVLKLWDGAFAAIHTDDPTPEECDEAQQRINKAMAQCRKMKMSITPKLHGMEMHVVNQMRTTPGGIGKHMEHWIEQYHQIGYRFDVSYRQVGSLFGQAVIRLSVEKRGRNPLVQMHKKKLQEAFTRRRKSNKSKRDLEDEKKWQVKKEKRDIAFFADLPEDSDLSKVRDDLECGDELDELEEIDELKAKLYSGGGNKSA